MTEEVEKAQSRPPESKPAAGPAAPVPAVTPVPALTYERPPAGVITRWHVRWAMLLATLYLMVTLQNTYLPDVRAAIKDWWASRQEAAAKADTLKQARAFERRLMEFAEPPAKIVWDEDPGAAAALVAGAGYRWVPVVPLDKGNRNSAYMGVSAPDPLFAAWPRAARALPPAALDDPPAGSVRFTPGDEDAIALLHGRRAPSGAERLVVVVVSGRQELNVKNGQIDQGPPDEGWSRPVKKYQSLTASLFAPGEGETPGRELTGRSTSLLIHPEADPLVTQWTYTPRPGIFDVPRRDRLRVFAGQPDPADAAHFTIAYDVDGQPGVIHGRLKDDDTVELRPTTGTVVGDRWYPHGK